MADVRAEYPSKHTVVESSAIQVDGHRIWKSYETLAVDGEDFSAIGEAFEQTGKVRHVSLGNGILSMMSQRELVDFAVEWIEKNRICSASFFDFPQQLRYTDDKDYAAYYL
ncbi:SPBc2 prophage-derived aminoglycoside N(3')-acetyltransferase-like protein YokD [Lachnospiraceae bacterium]|nr:SPBc2 prophage-derived aminoglycoside N(3')-acetyltransferase-like protein YokD [Lachnospiraceae bacterium]